MHSSGVPTRQSANRMDFSFGAIYGVGPSCWRIHQTRTRIRRGDNHANNLTQKARILVKMRFLQIATPALREQKPFFNQASRRTV